MEMQRTPPYPQETRAKGWKFELDHERIRQSDTWALAAPLQRPWLLMLWMVAWEQTPCGSLPDDDELIAARIGMPLADFQQHRGILLRGWWKATDGRLYHQVIIEKVLEMLARKTRETERKADYRNRKKSQNVPIMSHGTDKGQTGDGRGSPVGVTTPVPVYTVSKDTVTATPSNPPSSPREVIFGLGISILTGQGEKESQARSFLGKFAGKDEAKLAEVIGYLAANPKVQAKGYIAGAFKPEERRMVL